MEIIDRFCDNLYLNDLEKVSFIKQFADNIGVKARYIGLAVFAIISTFLVLEYGMVYIQLFFGCWFPAYMTFKAIESNEVEQNRVWLVYWVIYTLLTLGDRWVMMLLRPLPFVSIIKILLYVALYNSKIRGASYIYQYALRPLFKKYEPLLDKQLIGIQEVAAKKYEEAKPMLQKARQSITRKAAKKAVDHLTDDKGSSAQDDAMAASTRKKRI